MVKPQILVMRSFRWKSLYFRRLLYPIWFYVGTTEVILLYAAVDMRPLVTQDAISKQLRRLFAISILELQFVNQILATHF